MRLDDSILTIAEFFLLWIIYAMFVIKRMEVFNRLFDLSLFFFILEKKIVFEGHLISYQTEQFSNFCFWEKSSSIEIFERHVKLKADPRQIRDMGNRTIYIVWKKMVSIKTAHALYRDSGLKYQINMAKYGDKRILKDALFSLTWSLSFIQRNIEIQILTYFYIPNRNNRSKTNNRNCSGGNQDDRWRSAG